MAGILGGKMAKTIVYNFAYISVNKFWKNFSLGIYKVGVLRKLTEKLVFQKVKSIRPSD
jgi:hypothetical protein